MTTLMQPDNSSRIIGSPWRHRARGTLAALLLSAASALSLAQGERQPAGIAGGGSDVFFQPALQAGQVSLFTGDASYSYSLDMPSGTGGLSVPLTLTYSSSVVNRQTGGTQQDGGLLGIGWTLDIGTIQDTGEDLTMTLGGSSEKLVESGSTPWSGGAVGGIEGWSTLDSEGSETARVARYATEHANYTRIRRYERDFYNGFACYCDPADPMSGCLGEPGGWVQGWIDGDGWWEVTGRNGTVYEFGRRSGFDAIPTTLPWQGAWANSSNEIGTQGRFYYVHMTDYGAAQKKVTMRGWGLDRIRDVHGNTVEIDYVSYPSQMLQGYFDCPSLTRFGWKEVYPKAIRYTTNSGQGDNHAEYLVEFDLERKSGDNQAMNQIGRTGVLLRGVKVTYRRDPAATPIVVREYRFTYDIHGNEGALAHTLTRIDQYGRGGEAGQSSLPPVTFTYQERPIHQGAHYFLTAVANAYGGSQSFTYANWSGGEQPRQRVTGLTADPGAYGTPVAHTYTYGTAHFQAEEGGGPSSLVGFDDVTETLVGGPIARTYFHAEDLGVDEDPGPLSGQIWRVETCEAGSNCSGRTLRQRTTDTWQADPAGLPEGSQFVYKSETVSEHWGDDGTAYSNKTRYAYGGDVPCSDNDCTGPSYQYGNLTLIEEYESAAATVPRRTTWTPRCPREDVWIVDRTCATVVYQGEYAGPVLSTTWHVYSGDAGWKGMNALGELRATRRHLGSQIQDTLLHYDGFGNVVRTRAFSGYGTATTYATVGERKSTTNYDSYHHVYPIEHTNDLEHTLMSYFLDVNATNPNPGYGLPGKLKVTTDANGLTRVYRYDASGRPLYTWVEGGWFDSAKAQTQHVYGDTSSPPYHRVSSRDDDYSVTLAGTYQHAWTYYDGLGRVIQIQSEGNPGEYMVTSTRYDAQGRVDKQTVPHRRSEATGAFLADDLLDLEDWPHVTTAYDLLGRQVSITNIDGTVRRFSYDVADRGVFSEDESGQFGIKRATDPFGNIIEVRENTKPGSSWTNYATTRMSYDTLDRLIRIEDTMTPSHVWTFTYDGLGRKTQMTDPDLGTLSYGYDALGNLTLQQDQRDKCTCLYYDTLNRLVGKDFRPPGSCPQTPQYDVAYEYDGAGANGIGRRTRMWHNGDDDIVDGWTEFTYDVRGRLTRKRQHIVGAPGSPYEMLYTYDQADRIRTTTYPPGNEVVTASYDAAGRPYSLTTTLGGPYVERATYEDFGAGPEEIRWGNGLRTRYEYYDENGRHRLNRTIVSVGATATWHQRMTYAGYDSRGNLLTLRDERGPATSANPQLHTYGYDPLGRLTSTQVTGGTAATYARSYTYDRIGRMLTAGTETYGYDAGHVHARSRINNTVWYSYDAAGNMETRREGNDTYTHYWSTENRLLRVDGSEGTTRFRYDADSSRVERNGPSGTAYYFGPSYEIDDGVVVKSYWFGGKRIAVRRGGTLRYLHGDHQGSTVLISNETGAAVAQYRYEDFGRLRWSSGGESALEDHRYTGQRIEPTADVGAEIYDYGARHYEPAVQQFLSADTIVPDPMNPQSLNRYAYVINNPIRFTDPTGHCAEMEGQRNGLCLNLGSSGDPVGIVQGGSVFVNYVEVMWANYILSGNEARLAALPDGGGIVTGNSVGVSYLMATGGEDSRDMIALATGMISLAGCAGENCSRTTWSGSALGSGGGGGGGFGQGKLGQLSSKQASQIQKAVDKLGEPLAVVGGMAQDPAVHPAGDTDFCCWGAKAYALYNFDPNVNLPGRTHGVFGLPGEYPNRLKTEWGAIVFRPGERPVYYPPSETPSRVERIRHAVMNGLDFKYEVAVGLPMLGPEQYPIRSEEIFIGGR